MPAVQFVVLTVALCFSGCVPMEEVESMLLLPPRKNLLYPARKSTGPFLKPELRVRVEHLQGGSQWGCVVCTVDLSALKVSTPLHLFN